MEYVEVRTQTGVRRGRGAYRGGRVVNLLEGPIVNRRRRPRIWPWALATLAAAGGFGYGMAHTLGWWGVLVTLPASVATGWAVGGWAARRSYR